MVNPKFEMNWYELNGIDQNALNQCFDVRLEGVV
jgi:hypothetical protein